MRNKKVKMRFKVTAAILILSMAALSGCKEIKKDCFNDTSSLILPEESVPEEKIEAEKNSVTDNSKEIEQFSSADSTESYISDVSSITRSESKESSVSLSQQEKPETPKSSDPTESKPAEPVVKDAGAGDVKEIADKLIQYINEYRISEGSNSAVKLTGLTVYAEYRSRQLVANFKHDTLDERAAATALKYGMYIEPSEFGGHGEPYYAACVREAIAQAGYIGSVEYIAQRFATLTKNSSGHWTYVGSSEYSYIAVGVTYEGGMWYCDIAMSQTNEYEN